MVFVSQPVLLVEDDDGDQLLIRQAMSQLQTSIDINAVTTLAAARDYLSGAGKYASAPRPRCVVLDLRLPDGRGEALLDWMAERPDLDALPVITLSGAPLTRGWPNVVATLSKPTTAEGYDALGGMLGRLIVAAVDGPLHRNDNFVVDDPPQA